MDWKFRSCLFILMKLTYAVRARARANTHSTEAVSYTHLDVYKRQK